MRILCIERDESVAQSLALILTSEGHNVSTALSGEEGLELATLYDYDLILLELALPDMNGDALLRRLRTAKIPTPVLVLSRLAGIEDKVKALACGADDYLTKPFHRDELVARANAIVRRARGFAQSVVAVGDLRIDLDRHSVTIAGAPLRLTGKELSILQLLALRKGYVVTKEMVMDHLYDGRDEPELKIVDVFICKIRHKLAAATANGGSAIETVWGRGYMLRETPLDEPASYVRRGKGVRYGGLPRTQIGEEALQLTH